MVANVDGTGLVAVGDTTGIVLPFAWADEDHLLVASKNGLSRMAVQGGGLEVVARTDSGESDTNPSVLPDGHGFLFTVVPRDYADLSRYRIEITDGRPNGSRVLMPGVLARYVPGHLLVVRADGSLFAFPFDLAKGRVTGPEVLIATGLSVGEYGVVPFDATENGRVVYGTGEAGEDLRDLVRVARDGKVTPLDTSWVGDFESVAASRNGEQLATFTVTPSTQEIDVHDLRSGAASHYAIPGLECRDPIFSTVGSTLYFTGTSGAGNGGVYQVEPGSAAPPHLVFQLSNHILQYLALTPGDARMLYDRYGASEAPQLFAHALAGAATPDASVQGTAPAEFAPAVSPDGRWLAYVSIESGAGELYVRSMDSSRGERWQVSQRGPGYPRWSHDGRELLYFAQDSMMVADVTPGAQFKIGKPHGLFSTAGFMSGDEPFDVLPGDAFLMIRRHVSRPGAAQLVMLERWDAGLASGNLSH